MKLWHKYVPQNSAAAHQSKFNRSGSILCTQMGGPLPHMLGLVLLVLLLAKDLKQRSQPIRQSLLNDKKHFLDFGHSSVLRVHLIQCFAPSPQVRYRCRHKHIVKICNSIKGNHVTDVLLCGIQG